MGMETARIAGAQHIPMREVPSRFEELERDRDVVAICHHGGFSLQVAMFLEKNGFARVHATAAPRRRASTVVASY